VGYQGCLRWFATLRVFSLLATGADASIRRVKYVDVNSFFSILWGANRISRACAFIAAAALLLWLARAWWMARNQNKETLIAATLAIMLAANFYVPVYDTIILVAAIALVAGEFTGNKTFRVWILLLYLVPSLTQSFAEFARIQFFTPLAAGFGLWILATRRDYEHPAHSLR
jgi:hypothetical protein